MLRIIIAKICIAFCFIYYVWTVYDNEYALSGYKNRLRQNIIDLTTIKQQQQELLRMLSETLVPYLIFMMVILPSIIMVISRSMIYKILAVIGFIIFNISNQNPRYRFNHNLQGLQQGICIVGGMLCLMGLDKQNNNKILLSDRQFQQFVNKKQM